MYMPSINVIESERTLTESFTGLDLRPRTAAGAFSDMRNMSGDPYPLISSRKRRGLVRTLEKPRGMLAMGKIAYIDGATLYYDGVATPINNLSDVTPKRMVAMGAYLIVFPDGAYYNTANAQDYGNMNRLYESEAGENVTFQLCQMDGTVYDAQEITVSKIEPAEPEDGAWWLDTSEDTHVLKQWRSNYGMWISQSSVYVKISCEGIGKGLRVQDTVTVSGVNHTGEVSEAMKAQYAALNATQLVWACDDDYIVVVGIVDQAYTQTTGSVRVDRKAPGMDYVVECNNRLWGCRAGMENGETINEIYASALGDFKNWRKYTADAQASYAVSVGTDGAFTGAISHRGNPYFFKQQCVHKLYGDKPSNFQMQTTMCDGVRESCADSLQAINGVLYYVGLNGVNYFETLPMDASEALGEMRFEAAVAGEHDGKYYVSAKANEQWGLYCLDTLRGTWHKEDDAHVIAFARLDAEIYMLLEDGRMYAMHGTQGTTEDAVEWYADSGVIGYEYPDQKYLGRFNIRMKLGKWADCTVYVEYDSSGVWEERGRMAGSDRVRTYTLPVVPRRCDHMRIRLAGRGEVQIYSFARTLIVGADG